MKSNNQAQGKQPVTATGTTAPFGKASERRRKNRTLEMTRVKTLIAGLSMAATVGGWGMMTQHDGTSAAQTPADQTNVASLVSQTSTQQTSDATATSQPEQATATAQATDTLTSSLQTIATATPQVIATVAAEASATPQATDTATATTAPKATATPKPTSTPKAAIAVTRSSK